MFRRVSDGKPVEMQYSDEDGEVLSVSTDTNRDLILKLEATIVMRLRSPVPVSGGTSGDQSKYCRRSQRYCGHLARVGLLLLWPGPGQANHRQVLPQTWCHGLKFQWSIGISSSGGWSCSGPLPSDWLQVPPICRRLPHLSRSPSPTGRASTLTDAFKIISLG